MSKYKHRGSVHLFDKEKSSGGDGHPWGWLISLATFFIVLALL